MNVDDMSMQKIIQLVCKEIIQEVKENEIEAFFLVRLSNELICKNTFLGKRNHIINMVLSSLRDLAEKDDDLLNEFLIGFLNVYQDKYEVDKEKWEQFSVTVKEYLVR